MVRGPDGEREINTAGLLTAASAGGVARRQAPGREPVPLSKPGSISGQVLFVRTRRGRAACAAGMGVWLASASALATVAAFVALRFHILQGRACETRTIAAMMLRMVIWQAIMVVAWRGALNGFHS